MERLVAAAAVLAVAAAFGVPREQILSDPSKISGRWMKGNCEDYEFPREFNETSKMVDAIPCDFEDDSDEAHCDCCPDGYMEIEDNSGEGGPPFVNGEFKCAPPSNVPREQRCMGISPEDRDGLNATGDSPGAFDRPEDACDARGINKIHCSCCFYGFLGWGGKSWTHDFYCASSGTTAELSGRSSEGQAATDVDGHPKMPQCTESLAERDSLGETDYCDFNMNETDGYTHCDCCLYGYWAYHYRELDGEEGDYSSDNFYCLNRGQTYYERCPEGVELANGDECTLAIGVQHMAELEQGVFDPDHENPGGKEFNSGEPAGRKIQDLPHCGCCPEKYHKTNKYEDDISFSSKASLGAISAYECTASD